MEGVLSPLGVYFSKSNGGRVYVVNEGCSNVLEFTSDLTTRLNVYGEGVLNNPSFCVALGSELFVSDCDNSRVIVFDLSSNSVLRSFEITQFPRGLTEQEGKILISSFISPSSFSTLDRNGNILNVDIASLQYPFGMEFDPSESLLYVVENGKKRICVISNGNIVHTFGEDILKDPIDVCISETQLFVSDYGLNVIQIFEKSGIHTSMIERGALGPFYCPRGVAIDNEKGVLYVSDSFNHRVQIITAAEGGFKVESKPAVEVSKPMPEVSKQEPEVSKPEPEVSKPKSEAVVKVSDVIVEPVSEPQPVTAPPLETTTWYTMEELKMGVPPGVVPHQKEEYLSENDFLTVFGMDKVTFAALPKWKKDAKKKDVGLF